MSHPIPAPRRPVDTRPAASTRPVTTPTPAACASCAHPTCRTQRARILPRLGGHRAEFAREHHQAAQVQAHNRHLLIYFGEATQSFWIATSAGLEEARDIDALLLKLWPHTDPPATRPWARNLGGPRVPTMA
ncbi:hypothetical protein [Nocardiopsis alkaliphila]|uniref:hypothetical protein n=1 Tax=Nocardiopsis alkaliphila TaxID=225762 RepID=UPI0003495AAF|nr:hypothetical protein [Nocardiopsis alkaliphila]